MTGHTSLRRCLTLILTLSLLGAAAELEAQSEPPSLQIAFKVPFDPPPGFSGYLPQEAYLGNLTPFGEKPRTDPAKLGSFTGSFANRARRDVAAVTVRWMNSEQFKDQSQAAELLREVFSSVDTRIYAAHIGSWLDAVPTLVADVQHKSGAPGRLVLWCPSPASYWAYQDPQGIWMWGASPRRSCHPASTDLPSRDSGPQGPQPPIEKR